MTTNCTTHIWSGNGERDICIVCAAWRYAAEHFDDDNGVTDYDAYEAQPIQAPDATSQRWLKRANAITRPIHAPDGGICDDED